MRGTGGPISAASSISRITPACAGNRHLHLLRCWTIKDHPRVCGEQLSPLLDCTTHIGSPPRVRGTVPHYPRTDTAARITPACAGNSSGKSTATAGYTDHPRVCGEQMRDIHTRCREEWITPACAGNRPVLACTPLHQAGSPPRVRGTEGELLACMQRIRITPACAGNSCCTCRVANIKWDHPRVCGEQTERPPKGVDRTGSPPRVRGTGKAAAIHAPQEGITPACAGNSLCRAKSWMKIQDHPRVCGEQPFTYRILAPFRGSPPRVRGTAEPV